MSISKEKKESLMKIVMQEVEKAVKEGNSPFGAILIDENGNIVEKANNKLNIETGVLLEECQSQIQNARNH